MSGRRLLPTWARGRRTSLIALAFKQGTSGVPLLIGQDLRFGIQYDVRDADLTASAPTLSGTAQSGQTTEANSGGSLVYGAGDPPSGTNPGYFPGRR